MKYAKLISLLLLVCIVSALSLSACEMKKDDNSNDASQVQAGTKYQDADGKYIASTSGNTYEGETITFLTCSVNSTYESEILSNIEAYKEEGLSQVLPTSVNDDMQERANILEETLGITLEEEKYFSPKRPGGEICEKIRTDVFAGSADYQVVVPCLYDAATLALEDLFVDLRSVSALQIDAPWWNQEFNESMTFSGQLYFTIGDIGLVNKNATAAVYVNLDLWDKYDLSSENNLGADPYKLVRSGKWTLDAVKEASSVISNDVNQDGKIDYQDEFGWGGQLDDMWSIFFGAGERIASADADGFPTITMYSERSAKLMEKLQEFVQDDKHYVSANDYFSVVQWPTVLVQEAFTSGRAMFYSGGVSTIVELGNMEDRFGILPAPKYDAQQESYHSLVNPWSSTCFAIPTTVRDEDLIMTADALNVLGATSANTVAKNYQEIVIENMKLRDDESVEMLNEYILPNRSVDVGMIYKWGGLDTMLQEMADASVGSFSSKFDALEEAAELALEEDIQFYKDKE